MVVPRQSGNPWISFCHQPEKVVLKCHMNDRWVVFRLSTGIAGTDSRISDLCQRPETAVLCNV